MRSLLVVVLHELGQHGSQVLFIQHYDVVEALAAQGANHSLHDSVHVRRQLPAVAAIRSDSM